ncbi:MAG TPA: hypothetical protein PKD61_35250 [Polyangiaceae bacterium]|nr:hypothetical protein [Polyangiaceae bacterium]
MKARTTLAAIVAASILAIPALATPGEVSGKSFGALRTVNKRVNSENSAMNEQDVLKKLIEAGIDEPQATRVIAINKYYGSEMKKEHATIAAQRKILDGLVRSNSANEAAYKDALYKVQYSKTKLQSISNSRASALRTLLKPSQQAKLMSLKLGRVG